MAGDSNVVKIGNDLMKYLKDMIIIDTKYHYDKEGKIIEEKKRAQTNQETE